MENASTSLDRQPVLTSDLLVVRPLEADDEAALWEVSSDPLLWEQHPAKERATRDGFGRWMVDALASGGALVVIERDSGEIIGTSRYDHYNPEASAVEIGWTFLARSHWGRGFNSELKRLMLEHAFDSVDVVRLRAHEGNVRSQTAIGKLGARLVGEEPDPRGHGSNLHFELTRQLYGARG